MSKTPQEVEEYLRRHGQQQEPVPVDPVAEYLSRYGGPGQQQPPGFGTDATMFNPQGERQIPRAGAALLSTGQGATFGFGDELGGLVAAAVEGLSGNDPIKAYRAARDDLRAKLATAREEHPGTALAGNIAGGIGSAIATGGASLLPKGATALGRIGLGAAGGAGGAAIAGAGEADGGLAERLEGAARAAPFGALFGGGFAAAAPVVSRAGSLAADLTSIRPQSGSVAPQGVVASANPIPSPRDLAGALGVRSVPERAADIALRDVQDAGRTLQDLADDIATRQQQGVKPEGLAELLGHTGQRRARAVRTAGGPGAQRIDDALASRSAGAEERIIADLLDTSGQGKSTNRFQHLDELIDERRANARPLYEKAYQAAPIDDPDVLATLELPQFQQAYQRAQRIAKLEGIDLPDLGKNVTAIPIQALDYVKRGLDDVIDSGMRSGSIARTEARALRNRLAEMLAKVDEAVPEYKAARAQFAGDSELIEAAERGRDLFKTHPDEARQYLESLSEAGKDAYRKHALSALQDRIENIAPGNNVSRRVGEKTLDRKRLRLMFPDDASFDRFMEALAREAQMHATTGFVRGGSQTADKLADLADLAGISVDALMAPTRGIAGMADWIARRGAVQALGGVTRRNADELSKLYTLGLGGDIPAEHRVLLEALAEAERRAGRQATRRTGQTIGVGAAGGGQAGRERK